LALYDSWLFAAIKKHLKGIHFTYDEDVQAATEKNVLRIARRGLQIGLKNCFRAGGTI
jgi:hypothetical protein